MFDRDRPRAVDDAGEPIRAIDLDDLAACGEADLVKRLKTAVRLDGGSSHRGQAVGLVIAVGAIAVWIVLAGQGVIPRSVGLPLFIAGLVVLTIVSRVTSSKMGRLLRKGGVARTVVAHGYCGGCGYDLRGAQAGGDGLVVCTECGARWRGGSLGSARRAGGSGWDPLGKGKGRAIQSARLANDDRGALFRRIVSVPRSMPKVGRARWKREDRVALGRVRRASGIWWRVGTLPLSGFFAFVGVWMFVGISGEVDVASAVGASLLPFGIALMITAWAWLGDFGVRTSSFVRRVRDAGICAGCATPLTVEERDAEGFCVCGTCGLSWKPGAERGGR